MSREQFLNFDDLASELPEIDHRGWTEDHLIHLFLEREIEAIEDRETGGFLFGLASVSLALVLL